MKLESSSIFLQESFEWAQNKTRQFIVTGTKNGDINKGDGGKWYGPNRRVIKSPSEDWAKPKDYKPAFWAGYFDRTAYYIRDFVHQALGAYLTGLDEEVYNMFYTFVSNASEKTGWFAPWAFNFDGSIYYMDTPNLNEFVREITSQFELVETAYKLYLWTGDNRYINDNVIFNFIEKIMTDFISNLDGAVLPYKNGIPEGFGDIFKITSTYNERGFHAAEAGDSIAAMYQAILAYANILSLRGKPAEAEKQFIRANGLRDYFNNDWSVIKNSDMFAYAIDNKGKKHYKWIERRHALHGGESLFFIPLKRLSYPNERNEKLLDYIFEKELDKKTRGDNIESLTYLPEVFFPYGQSERAWFWMKHIISQKDKPHERKSQGKNGDYPEISFTFISQVIEGIMGITVNAAEGTICVSPNLPEEIEDIRLTDFKYGNKTADIIINKNNVSVLTK
ncbi:MAG: hypothetical protein J1E34_05095 [Oscillospiraceae bacterium]|nr:hypothetical protein [Oscillospiraceae bacterium]